MRESLALVRHTHDALRLLKSGKTVPGRGMKTAACGNRHQIRGLPPLPSAVRTPAPIAPCSIGAPPRRHDDDGDDPHSLIWPMLRLLMAWTATAITHDDRTTPPGPHRMMIYDTVPYHSPIMDAHLWETSKLEWSIRE